MFICLSYLYRTYIFLVNGKRGTTAENVLGLICDLPRLAADELPGGSRDLSPPPHQTSCVTHSGPFKQGPIKGGATLLCGPAFTALAATVHFNSMRLR